MASIAPRQSSSLPEDMHWITCQSCKLSAALESTQFVLSHCGHIFCTHCRAQNQCKCPVCGRTHLRFMPITPEIKQHPQVGHLFWDGAQTLKEILEVLTFQEMHAKLWREHKAKLLGGGSSKCSSEKWEKIEEKRQEITSMLREAEFLVKEMRGLGQSDREVFLFKGEGGEPINAAQILRDNVKLVSNTAPGPALGNTITQHKPRPSASASTAQQSVTQTNKSTTPRPSASAAQQSVAQTTEPAMPRPSALTAQQSVGQTNKSTMKRSLSTTSQSTAVRSTVSTPRHGNQRQQVTAQGSATRHSSKAPTTPIISPTPLTQSRSRNYTAQGSAVRRTSSNVSTPQSALSGAPQAKRSAASLATPPTTGHQFGLYPFAGSAKCPPPLSARAVRQPLPPPPPPPPLSLSQPSHPYHIGASPLTRMGVSQDIHSTLTRRTPSHITPSPHMRPSPVSLQGTRTPGQGDPSPFKTPTGVVGHATRRVPGQVTPSSQDKMRTTPTSELGRLSLRPRPSGGRFVGRSRSPSPMLQSATGCVKM